MDLSASDGEEIVLGASVGIHRGGTILEAVAHHMAFQETPGLVEEIPEDRNAGLEVGTGEDIVVAVAYGVETVAGAGLEIGFDQEDHSVVEEGHSDVVFVVLAVSFGVVLQLGPAT